MGAFRNGLKDLGTLDIDGAFVRAPCEPLGALVGGDLVDHLHGSAPRRDLGMELRAGTNWPGRRLLGAEHVWIVVPHTTAALM